MSIPTKKLKKSNTWSSHLGQSVRTRKSADATQATTTKDSPCEMGVTKIMNVTTISLPRPTPLTEKSRLDGNQTV